MLVTKLKQRKVQRSKLLDLPRSRFMDSWTLVMNRFFRGFWDFNVIIAHCEPEAGTSFLFFFQPYSNTKVVRLEIAFLVNLITVNICNKFVWSKLINWIIFSEPFFACVSYRFICWIYSWRFILIWINIRIFCQLWFCI